MPSPAVHRAIYARLQARQGVVPVGPAAMPAHGQDKSLSGYFTTGGAMTMTDNLSNMPTATALVIDTTAVQSVVLPSALPRTTISASSSPNSNASIAAVTSAVSSSSVSSSEVAPTAVVDPFQQVYNGMMVNALHSRPPWVITGACLAVGLVALITLYCLICRWYYKRLPRSTKRWDVDDRAKKELVYGDQPHFSPDEKVPDIAEDDRRGVPVGDSYFPQGEIWRKFEGRTARHPESFIHTGTELKDEPGLYSPTTPPLASFARPRPRFVHGPRHDSVFSNVSFPTTHRADSIRESDFFPDGFEHDGEVWDLASPNFVPGDARASFDSTVHSVSVNRASIFGQASARARGSVVVYDSQPMHSPGLDEDPFAGPLQRGEKFFGKKSFDGGRKSFEGGKKSMDGYHSHVRSKSRDVRELGTLAEEGDESSHGHEGNTSPVPRG